MRRKLIKILAAVLALLLAFFGLYGLWVGLQMSLSAALQSGAAQVEVVNGRFLLPQTAVFYGLVAGFFLLLSLVLIGATYRLVAYSGRRIPPAKQSPPSKREPMIKTIRLITQAEARQFARWVYEPPYDIYNILPDPNNPDMIEQAANYFYDPAVQCYAIVDDAGDLLAFCTFGEDAQVPGGDYGRAALDIGLGVRPDLTGQGMGREFVTAVIDFTCRTFRPAVLRVTIAAFNRRAQRVWEQQGFVPVQQFNSVMDEKRPFLILEKTLTGIAQMSPAAANHHHE